MAKNLNNQAVEFTNIGKQIQGYSSFTYNATTTEILGSISDMKDKNLTTGYGFLVSKTGMVSSVTGEMTFDLGQNYLFSILNVVVLNAGAGTCSFQYSTNGSTWVTLLNASSTETNFVSQNVSNMRYFKILKDAGGGTGTIQGSVKIAHIEILTEL